MIIIGCLLIVLLTVGAQAAEPTNTNVEELARTIVVDIPGRMLTLYVDDEPVKTYPIAVGKPSSPTPVGSFNVVSIVADPPYYNPAIGKWGPGEKGNPVGTRWIGLNIKGYGIHGTSAPRSIGRAASHGCIRMRNQDAEDLSRQIKVGDEVEIIYELSDEDDAGKDIYKRYAQLADPAANQPSAGQ